MIGLLVVIFWPTDFLLFQNRPKIIMSYAIWRSSLLGLCALSYLLLKYFNWFQDNINLVVVSAITIAVSVVAFSLSRLGGLQDPWFWNIYLVPWTTLLLGLHFVKRFLATVLITLAYGTTYFLTFPAHLHYDYLGVPLVLTSAIVIASTICGHIFFHLLRQNYFRRRKLRQKRQEVEYMANHDQLTDLMNRRHFEERLKQEMDGSRRYGNDLSVIVFDLDHFKSINDTYGHPKGDEVLERVGTLLNDHTRSIDAAGRYGGEEFCLLLPETSASEARTTAERIRSDLETENFATENGETFTVTASVGVAEMKDDHGETEDLFKDADEALYRAKETGRNRVIVAE
jgi:diguanylate cyclase (GGDEF)-like protein